MMYQGIVQNGVVVLAPGAQLAEGAEVRVEEIRPKESEALEATEEPLLTAETDPLMAAILKLAKPRPHWPDDYVLNHGHYVSGEPKKS